LKPALIATLCLLASACANQRAEREALLSPQAQLLLGKYRQFMTQRQLDEFLAWEDDGARETYVKGLRVEERLAGYSQPMQDAIWAKNVILGMDKPAVLLTWGPPPTREFSGTGGNETETWYYVRDERKIGVVLTNGFVSDVVDEGYSR
jgi:hypothetical protein